MLICAISNNKMLIADCSCSVHFIKILNYLMFIIIIQWIPENNLFSSHYI